MEIGTFIDFPDIKDYVFSNHTKVGETIFAFMRRFYENIILADMNNVYMGMTNEWVGDVYHYIHRLYGIGISFIETHSSISNKIIYIPNMDEYPVYMGDFPTHRYIDHFEHCGMDQFDVFDVKTANSGIPMTQRIKLIHAGYVYRDDDKIDLGFHVMYHYNDENGIGWERYDKWMAFQETLLFLQAIHNIKDYHDDDKYIKEEDLHDIIRETPF